MKNKPYQPISCDTYDELELLAMRKERVEIRYKKADEIHTIKSVIVDVFTKNKVEFLKIENDQEIRLDHLISVNDKAIIFKC